LTGEEKIDIFAKKSNVTLSIPDNILKELRHDSKFENASINQKVNNILLRWLFLYRAIDIQKAVVIPHETWRQIIELLEEDFLSSALDHGADTVGATLAHIDIQPSIENVIEFIFNKISLYSGTVSHFHHYKDESDNLHLVFEHSLGKKWSVALGKSFCRFFNQQYGLRTDLSTTPRIITITVHTNNIR
jgi:hypothetical protein